MWKRVFVIYLCLLSGYAAFSQDVDSIRLAQQIDLLKELSHRNYDSTIIISEQVSREAKIHKQQEINWEALLFLADAYAEISKADSAFSILSWVVDQAMINQNRIYEIKARIKLGEQFQNKYQFDKSIDNLMIAQKLLKDSDDFSLRFDIMNGLAITHRFMKDYGKALEIFQNILDNYFFQLDVVQKFSVYNNLGIVEASQRDYSSAEKYMLEAYEIIKSADNPENLAKVSYNLGVVYVRLQEYKKADNFINSALVEYRKMSDFNGIENSTRSLAAIQLDMENYAEAERLSFQALDIARQIDNRRKILGNYKNLYLIYERLGDETSDSEMLRKELEYFQKWAFLKDSMYQTEMTDKIFELEKQYETEKKNGQIALLQKDNQIKEEEIKLQHSQRNSLLIFAIFILGVLGFFMYALNRNRKLNRLLQAQSKRIVAQSEQIFNQNKKLQKAIETRDRLFSIIAHDLRSPLISIGNFSRLIDFYLRDNKLEELKRVGKDLETNNDYVLELTDNLLSWAKSQSEDLDPQFERVSIKEIVEQCLEIYSSISNEKSIELSFEETEDCLLWTDRNMVKTIMRNLINNAIKFTPEHGNVAVSYQMNDNIVEINVADTGIGMSPEQVKLLFDTDQREIRKGTLGEKSTGLGLSVCKDFINALNGEINVECVENKGCTFTVSLPCFQETKDHKEINMGIVKDFSDCLN
ncbi:tetratricopeptide repeat-containing sensor histidine kinase [Sunxiuqinia sp. A32]|uniref:tetratricopeptide repeat-containing sensor histidine kinase n=1 Tax=Sunxiuqinia sp. A32 TaxID=3461496 RepID=UPI004045DAF4